MNLINSSHFHGDQINITDDHDHHHNFALHHLVSSPSSRIFLIDSTQDLNGYYHHHYLYQPHYPEDDEKYGYHGGSPYEMIKNTVDNSGLKLTLRPKKEDDHHVTTQSDDDKDINQVKRLSPSKIRFTQKKNKNPNFAASEPSSSLETDLSSNTSSYNNPTIRACADCNTTKTPLWRSGPKGPKSLCNACGIRQRKARRAMAAATAVPTGTVVAASDPPPPAVKKIKVQHKEKKLLGQNGHTSSQFKKQIKMAAGLSSSSSSSSRATNKVGLEEFLINLSNNLSLHRVFPEDEKDAAILLMALSSGLVHG